MHEKPETNHLKLLFVRELPLGALNCKERSFSGRKCTTRQLKRQYIERTECHEKFADNLRRFQGKADKRSTIIKNSLSVFFCSSGGRNEWNQVSYKEQFCFHQSRSESLDCGPS